MNENKIITIPNILSFFRLTLIPFIVYFYVIKEDYTLAAILIVISGITDILDGQIARRFNMISNFGKVLDPIADKLTQFSLIISLNFRYHLLIILIVIFVIKEALMAIWGLTAINKKKIVNSAKWHGKVATVILYLVIFILVIFTDIDINIANFLIIIAFIAILISLILYGKFYFDLFVRSKHV